MRHERTDFRFERADLGPDRAALRPEIADLRPERTGWGGRTDKQTNTRTNGQKSPCSTGLCPLQGRYPRRTRPDTQLPKLRAAGQGQ